MSFILFNRLFFSSIFNNQPNNSKSFLPSDNVVSKSFITKSFKNDQMVVTFESSITNPLKRFIKTSVD